MINGSTVSDTFRRASVVTAIGGFIFYVGWNIWWLVQGRIPPSIMKGLFNLPAPTTGMTRSLTALLNGEVWQSLCWNPFTLPTIILYAVTFSYLLFQFLRSKSIVLPRLMSTLWIVILSAAWIAKFAIGSQSW